MTSYPHNGDVHRKYWGVRCHRCKRPIVMPIHPVSDELPNLKPLVATTQLRCAQCGMKSQYNDEDLERFALE